MEEFKQENAEIKETQVESSSSEGQLLPKDESVLELLDSINNYLLLMDSLSSTLRQVYYISMSPSIQSWYVFVVSIFIPVLSLLIMHIV